MSTRQYFSIRFFANVWLWAESRVNGNNELTSEELDEWTEFLDRNNYEYVIYRNMVTVYREFTRSEQESVGGRRDSDARNG